MPAEVEDARAVLRDRNELLAQANEEVQIVLAKARQEAELRLNSHDLVLDAQRRTDEIMRQSREEATRIREEARQEAVQIRGDATSQAVEQALEADRYSLDVLRRLDTQLSTLTSSVRAGMDQLQVKLDREQEVRAADIRDEEIRRRRDER